MKNREIKSDQDYFAEDSLKYYRDLKASLATRYEEGKEEGIKEVAIKLIRLNLSTEYITKATGLTEEQIEILKKNS